MTACGNITYWKENGQAGLFPLCKVQFHNYDDYITFPLGLIGVDLAKERPVGETAY